MPGLSEAEQAPAKKFYRQATMTYAKELAGQAKRALGKGKYQEALGLSQKSARYYSKISDASRAQAQSLAIEGRAYLAQSDFVSAQRAFVKAAELDPKAGYQKLAEEARRASSTGLPSRPAEVVAKF
jgi:tetratricopeptide (TPR) repeat protein